MYDKDFEKIMQHIFKLEGYISDDKDDNGGYTKFGVSTKFVKNNLQKLQKLGICKETLTPKECIKNLSEEQIKQIYYEFFYKPFINIKFYWIKAYCVDMAINMGIKTSVKILQKALNNCGSNLKVDGILGEKTLKEVNKDVYYLSDCLVISMLKYRLLQYVKIVVRYPKLLKFLKGWINRSFSWF